MVVQSGVIETRLSDHGLIFCSGKMSFLKSNENYEISLMSMKNHSYEIFVEELISVKYPDYSNHTCVNDAYQDFATKSLSVVNFVVPIRTLRVKPNIKPWFDIDILNDFLNFYTNYKKYKRSGKEINKSNFKCAKLLLKKTIIAKYFTLKKILQKIRIIVEKSGKLYNF